MGVSVTGAGKVETTIDSADAVAGNLLLGTYAAVVFFSESFAF
jgi:hypothetical protein